MRLGVIVFLAMVNTHCLNTENRAKYVDDLTIAEIISLRNEITCAQENLSVNVSDCR